MDAVTHQLPPEMYWKLKSKFLAARSAQQELEQRTTEMRTQVEKLRTEYVEAWKEVTTHIGVPEDAALVLEDEGCVVIQTQ